MKGKNIFIIILIILILILIFLLLFLWWQSQKEEEAPGERETREEERRREERQREERQEEVVDETATWKTHQIGGGPTPSSIKYPPDWFYKSIVGETPDETYEMFVNDENIENSDQELSSNQARMIVNLGPNNSPGEPLDDVIEAEKEWVQNQHPQATFAKKTIDEMKVLISSYQEGNNKVRVYYLVKADATGFFTCEFLDDAFIETFDKMIETVELGTIGVYQ